MSTADVQEVELDAITGEVELVEELCTETGQVLVSAGNTLTPKLCQMLLSRGIKTARVRQPTPSLSAEEVQSRLDQQFAACDDSETNRALRQLFENYHLKG